MTGLKETVFNNMVFKLNAETGDVDIFLQGIEGSNFKIEPMQIATFSEIQGIRYFPDKIKQYQEICKSQEIEPNLPEGLPDIEMLKERQGDDQKEPEEKEEEKQPEEKQEEKEEQEEEPKEENEEEKDEDNKELHTFKTLPPNAIKLNKNRLADPRKSVR